MQILHILILHILEFPKTIKSPSLGGREADAYVKL
jgi:hypothetical protein